MRPACLVFLLALAAQAETDWHSFADLNQARVVHSEFTLRVDFDRRVLQGEVRHRLSRPVRALSLDSKDISVASVRCGNRPARFSFGDADQIRGRELKLEFAAPCRQVRIAYETNPGASGLRWLKPNQTANGLNPFLATQSWSIHARSWAPLQDTPRAKFTYSAQIQVPPGMLALMSAENPQHPAPAGLYRFRMRRPIPPHLLALAVGDLRFAALGKRTGVYADPSKLEEAKAEFAEVELMMQAAEKICGKYRWGRFDILVLPPEAPFGGMENPRLTFVSDTLLTGDKSRVSVIAHELAHAWSGNQVSNATWGDIWVSEGLTTYITHRIQEAVYGRRRAGAAYQLALRRLQRSLSSMETTRQRVRQDAAGRHPDRMLGTIPYAKGSLLLQAAEQAQGRKAVDHWLSRYFRRHAWQSLTTADVRREFNLLPEAVVDAWLEQPGLPATPDLPLAGVAGIWDAMAATIRAGGAAGFSGWHAEEVEVVLEDLVREPGRLQASQLEAALSSWRQREIRAPWLSIAVAANYRPAESELVNYVGSAERRELTALFATMAKQTYWRELAVRLLDSNASRLGTVTTKALRAVLQ